MIKKKNSSKEKDKRDANITDNSFTQAVKNAGAGGIGMAQSGIEGAESEEGKEISIQAYDDLMRAKEAKNDTSVEGEKFRREE